MTTKTFEPLRPLHCAEAPASAYAETLGTGRTFYGESHWPSASYTIWKLPEPGSFFD